MRLEDRCCLDNLLPILRLNILQIILAAPAVDFSLDTFLLVLKPALFPANLLKHDVNTAFGLLFRVQRVQFFLCLRWDVLQVALLKVRLVSWHVHIHLFLDEAIVTRAQVAMEMQRALILGLDRLSCLTINRHEVFEIHLVDRLII